MRISPGRLKLAVVVACVLLVTGAALLLARHRHTPHGSGKAAASSPAPTTSTSSAAPATPTPAPPHSAATPGPATPSPARNASPSPKTTAHGITLVDGPYGFQVPQGWAFTPLTTVANTNNSRAAHWTDPASGARLDYLVVSTQAIYSVDHTVNLASIEAALPCQQLPPTSYVYLSGKGPRYTCPPMGGLNVNGLVLVKPYPQGFRLLQAEMPLAQDPLVAQILAGFH
ncbi:MAG: hypothetical protein QOH66_431 [Actinomycetota bacterium]|nr:hypothetical protein [Actinomycetota bacterium]